MSWNCLIMLCWIPQSPALFISCQVLKLCVKPSVCFENSVRIVYGSYTQCQECFCGYGGNWFLGISSTREPMVPPKHIIRVKKHESRVRRGKRMQRIYLKIKKSFGGKYLYWIAAVPSFASSWRTEIQSEGKYCCIVHEKA